MAIEGQEWGEMQDPSSISSDSERVLSGMVWQNQALSMPS
jgi:hypothetical protein